MTRREEMWKLQRGITALDLAIAFTEDREALGVGAAVERLRIGLKSAELWLGAEDELLMAQILSGSISPEDLSHALNSTKRTGVR